MFNILTDGGADTFKSAGKHLTSAHGAVTYHVQVFTLQLKMPRLCIQLDHGNPGVNYYESSKSRNLLLPTKGWFIWSQQKKTFPNEDISVPKTQDHYWK